MTPEPIKVTLAIEEIREAMLCGLDRQAESLRRGRRDAHGLSKNLMDGIWKHVSGAAGELAVAKALGLYWRPTVNSFKAADLGRDIQVRTRSRHDYDLIVRADDPRDHRFVLVTGGLPEFAVRGWILGGDAKQDRWRKSYGGRESAYFVPVGELRDISEMIADLVWA